MRLVVVPRWGGTSRDDWYPWLARRLGESHPVTFAELRPSPTAPAVAATVAAVDEAMAVGEPDRTVLIGHSVGCQAALRWLAGRRPGAPAAAGLLCIAGWWWVDEPWPDIRPWVDTPVDARAAGAASGPIRVIISDNDPFTADHSANAARWRSAVGATTRVVPGAAHFNGRREPAVLSAIVALLDEVGG